MPQTFNTRTAEEANQATGSDASDTDSDEMQANQDTDSGETHAREETNTDHGEAGAPQHIKDKIVEYMVEVELAIEKGSKILAFWDERAGERTRQKRDTGIYQEDLSRRLAGNGISVAEYEQILSNPDIKEVKKLLYRCYVVCNSKEARPTLEGRPPLCPFVIIDEGVRLVDLVVYHNFLRHKPEIDVHLFDEEVAEDGSAPRARQRPPTELFAYMAEPGAYPVNCLNLAGFKRDPLPDALKDLPDYDFLENVRENDQAGHAPDVRKKDLTGTGRFTLRGGQGAIHIAHRDRDHVITTFCCEAGEKLILMYPELTNKEVMEWMRDDLWSPSPEPFALFLKPGYQLIMPAGRVHEVLGLEDSLVTGCKLWHTLLFDKIVQAILQELQYPDVTNEDLFYECIGKLKVAKREWERVLRHGNGYWRFADEKKYQTFAEWLEVSYPYEWFYLERDD